VTIAALLEQADERHQDSRLYGEPGGYWDDATVLVSASGLRARDRGRTHRHRDLNQARGRG
jgi:hypothetical protein